MPEIFQNLSVLMGASWASGVRLYGTVAALGLAHRMGWLELPGDLAIASNGFVMTAAVVMAATEVLADKFPIVDSAIDSVNTFIKPVGGAAIAYLGASEMGPFVQSAAGLLGGGVSLTTHAVKSVTRVAVNTSPEPVTNIATSTAEDGVAAGGLWLLITNPILMAALVVLFLVFAVWFLRKMARFLKNVFKFFFKEKGPAQSSA